MMRPLLLIEGDCVMLAWLNVNDCIGNPAACHLGRSWSRVLVWQRQLN
jgi:hypothetical protein